MATTSSPSRLAGLETSLRPSPATRLTRTFLRMCRRAPLGVISAVLLIIVALIAIMAYDVAPFDPLKTNFAQTRKPPSMLHLIGTDNLGRDTLSRLIHGARVTLFVAATSVIIGDGIGFDDRKGAFGGHGSS